MSPKVLIPLLAAAFLAAPVFAPATLTGLSDSATAAIHVHNTKSKASYRMGGGGGGKGAAQRKLMPERPVRSDRMGGGGGGKGASGNAVKLNSSRSN